MLSLKLDVPVEDFFKNTKESKFIDKLSALLGITTDKLRIAGINKNTNVIDIVVESKELTGNEDANELKNMENDLKNKVKIIEGLASTG